MPKSKAKHNIRSVKAATMDDQYYHVSEPPSTMYSTLPRAGYTANPSYYGGYGYPDAEMGTRYPTTG
uniref:Uncharacterized protein n=1 Tax=Romanomermis culicivorax TaxID=13658 RepID=A0A915L143_ROMCU